MIKEFRILKSNGTKSDIDPQYGVQKQQKLTLIDAGFNSANSYNVCLTGDVAETDWQNGDTLKVNVNLTLCSYEHNGQVKMAKDFDSIELSEDSSNPITTLKEPLKSIDLPLKDQFRENWFWEDSAERRALDNDFWEEEDFRRMDFCELAHLLRKMDNFLKERGVSECFFRNHQLAAKVFNER